MIRFRFQEDERRFVRLHAEMFQNIARAGLPEVAGSDTLRNVSKIEQMAYMEGVRQGLALAAIVNEMLLADVSAIPEPMAQKAFQLHALIYGSSDTPLRSTEKEWLGKLSLDEDHLSKSWLDDKPMRFAPATLQELDGTVPPIAPMISIQAASKPARVLNAQESAAAAFRAMTSTGMTDLIVSQDDDMPPPEAMHGAEVTVPEPWHKGEYEPDEPDLGAEVQPESPEFLDIVRDAIQTLKRGGWDPKDWQAIILGLHRHMGVDAGFLDLQLSTLFGRTVLDQCGFAGLVPPEMMNFDFLDNPSGRSSPPPTTPVPAHGTTREPPDQGD